MVLQIVTLIICFPLTFCKILPISNNAMPSRMLGFKTFLENSVIHTHTDLLVSDEQNDFVDNLKDLLVLRTNSTELELLLNSLLNRPQSYIIVVSDIKSLNESLGVITSSEKHIGTAIYVLITAKEADIPKLAQALWDKRLPRSYIVFNDDLDQAIKIYILEIKNCGLTVREKKVATFRDGNVVSKILEWSCKLTFEGCPIYVVWSLMPPFVLGINTSFEGIYVEVIKVLGSISKRNIVYRPYDPIYLEEISQAYSYDVLANDFADEYAHLFAGPTDIHASTVVDVTPQISDDSLVFLVPRPVISYWEAILTPSTLSSAGISVIVLIGISIVFYVIARSTVDRFIFSSVIKTYFLFFGMTLNVSVLTTVPKSQYLRLILTTILVPSVIISTYIQGSLISSIRGSIYGPAIETVEELLDSHVPIKVLNGISYIFQQGRNEKEREVGAKLELLEVSYPFEAGNMALRQKNFATVVDAGFLIMRPNVLKSFSIFEVYNVKEAMGMPKNAFFSFQFNEWFTRIIEIGIIPKYLKIYQFIYALKYYVEEEKRGFTVTFQNIQPGLILLGAGYGLGVAILLFEILMFKCCPTVFERSMACCN